MAMDKVPLDIKNKGYQITYKAIATEGDQRKFYSARIQKPAGI